MRPWREEPVQGRSQPVPHPELLYSPVLLLQPSGSRNNCNHSGLGSSFLSRNILLHPLHPAGQTAPSSYQHSDKPGRSYPLSPAGSPHIAPVQQSLRSEYRGPGAATGSLSDSDPNHGVNVSGPRSKAEASWEHVRL